MPDPTPAVGLPTVEWVEIKNTTNTTINLAGWRISDANSVSGAIGNFNLQADSSLIICSSGSLAAMQAFGTAISVTSFPSLDNDGDVISIRSASGRTIHAVPYTVDWYQNAVKKDGGWSLEMIDTKNPCIGTDNWKASIDIKGGTPGKKNSIDAINNDTKAPQLLRTYTNSPTQIVAVFNEPVDSVSAALVSNYQFYAPNSTIAINSAIPQSPIFNTVVLNLSAPMALATPYRLIANNITDCKNNIIGAFNRTLAGLPQDADSLDLVVNEILFNPKPNGFDFVETYNRSLKIFDASKLYIANLNNAGQIANVKKLSEQPCLIFPGDFTTVTENASWLSSNYLVAQPANLLQIPSLPSFNDDAGNVFLLNFQGKIIDKLSYLDNWHFKLLDNEEGISLERINYEVPTQAAESWHSASSSSGYATPTAKNSQIANTNNSGGNITIYPKTFSPDNDGLDDVLSITYQTSSLGQLANVVLYDASGVPVRQLKRNDVLGNQGTWFWDGLNDKGAQLPTGIYVVWVEIFSTTGSRRQYKQTVILARKLK
jgi:hypothetical protein